MIYQKQNNMKTTVKNAEPQFAPIELTITIESEDERELLRKLFGRDVMIPNLLLEHEYISYSEKKELSRILFQIFQLLKKQ